MASITVRTRPTGATFWEVAYRHLETGRRTGRRFDSLEEAEAFRASLGQPIGRGQGWRTPRTAEQVRDLIAARSVLNPETGCMEWTRRITNAGYGQMTWLVGGRVERGAHRISYIAHVGPISDGMVIDHLCRNRACVNPEHMEPVTQRENVMRSPIAIGARNAAKTHCPSGHEYTAENTQVQVNPGGRTTVTRSCKACQRAAYARRKAVAS